LKFRPIEHVLFSILFITSWMLLSLWSAVKFNSARTRSLDLLLLLALLPVSAYAQPLEHLIASALASHPSAQGQRALVQSAEAGVDSARWQFYPTPSVSIETVNASATDGLYQGDNRVSTARLQQPLWTGGRLTAGMDRATAGLVVSHASLEEVRLQLGLRVVQAYGDWLSAYLKTLANEKSLATHVRLREQVKRRLTEGASAESDLTLAVARLELISADVTTARVQAEVALARLGQLLGSPVKGAVLAQAMAAPRELANAGRTGVQALLEAALGINPTVAKAQALARVQEAVIGERRADLAPEVYARIERQYGNYNFPNGAPENRLFIGLTSRFGAGLSSLSNVEAARTQHAAALTEIEAQSRTVSEQVLADYALAVSTVSRLASIKASLKAAADVSTSYDRQFLAGRKSWLDVMNAARELAQTETQLADLQATQLVVTWRLDAYTRGIDTVSEKKK
jgi:adhesin transport system outer membrane protein